jgi:arginase
MLQRRRVPAIPATDVVAFSSPPLPERPRRNRPPIRIPSHISRSRPSSRHTFPLAATPGQSIPDVRPLWPRTRFPQGGRLPTQRYTMARYSAAVRVPMDLGANRHGVDMGPSAIRYADIDDKLRVLGHEVVNLDTIHVPDADTRAPGDPRLRYLEQIVTATNELAQRVRQCIEQNTLPLVLGGDNAISLGSIAGVANARGPIGVIWLDAHGDFNTSETTPSGNIHGMILAALAGYGDQRLIDVGGPGRKVDPRKIVIVGARDLDPGEKTLLRQAGVNVRTIADIDRRGMSAIIGEALALAGEGANGVHIMFDMDVVDPSEAPGVGTPVAGGITYREAHLAMEMVAESGKLLSLDLVEVNPILDTHNRTALLATELALSALGKRIF